jgi:GMP reductase
MSDFDNVYLMPTEISTIRSRSDVSLYSDFFNLYPIFSSPMKGVSGSALVISMGENNCLGILHRFDTYEKRMGNIQSIYDKKVKYGIAIGVNDWDIELDIAEYAVDHGACLVCLDVASGYLPQIKEMGARMRNRLGSNIKLMTGNVINSIGAQYAKDSGFDFVRVGIGNGSQCSTRSVTGVSRNPLAALKDCSSVDIGLVVDGGIKLPGDISKAFAVGSDFAMIGTSLAYAEESEDQSGFVYGMASFKNHKLNNKDIKSIEGIETKVDITKKRPLSEILNEFLWGIRSCCTYINAKSYKEISTKAQIISVNESLTKGGESW